MVLKPTTPQKLAGFLRDPPKSDPVPSHAAPAASAEAVPPEEPPESTAYINISEIRPGENNKKAFDGWMFASSPGLNPLEHPVYDIWVLKCGHNEGDGENVGGTPQDGE